jgi:hypothetical protein
MSELVKLIEHDNKVADTMSVTKNYPLIPIRYIRYRSDIGLEIPHMSKLYEMNHDHGHIEEPRDLQGARVFFPKEVSHSSFSRPHIRRCKQYGNAP